MRRISAISCDGRAGLLKPVEVFTKSAPAVDASWHASTFCSSVSSAVSMMTLTMAPLVVAGLDHGADVGFDNARFRRRAAPRY